MTNGKIKIYTVSQVKALIKTALENNLPGRLTVTGWQKPLETKLYRRRID